MDNSTSLLAYYFNYDRDLSMGILHKFQTYYCLISLFSWHPLVLYLLIFESAPLSKEIRNGYIANQIGLMLNEWIFCILIRIYPLMPYPALHCGGLLCGLGIHPQILLTILAAGVILPNPPFEYLLLIMHQKLISNSNSTIRLSKRSQNAMISTLLLLLLLNIVGFGIFGRRTKKADEILARPELAWLASKGGEVFIFGDIGDPESFAIECYILGVVLIVVFPVVVFFSFHAVYIIVQMKKNTSVGSTTRLQVRLVNVLLTQLASVFKFYVYPLGVMIGMIMFGSIPLPGWAWAAGRPILTIEFIINPMPQSLIFLIKNNTYRKIIWNKMRMVFHSLVPYVYGTNPSVQSSNAGFSHFPSSSITRPIGA